jgi:polyphosphate kinase 2 (PPK2 family)
MIASRVPIGSALAAMKRKEFMNLFRAKPGKKGWLQDYDPAWAGTPEMKRLGEETLKDRAHELLAANLEALSASQALLYASDRYSVLIILQAMDAAGKDGTIRHVMSGVNPQGCEVFSFKKPSSEELDHNFLWRYMKSLPERGRIGIFNRSYYEDVLVVKVHPEVLESQRLPEGQRGKDFWQEHYDDINAFERHLVRNGTIIIKLFLNVSKKRSSGFSV